LLPEISHLFAELLKLLAHPTELLAQSHLPFREKADFGAEALRNDSKMPFDFFRLFASHDFIRIYQITARNAFEKILWKEPWRPLRRLVPPGGKTTPRFCA